MSIRLQLDPHDRDWYTGGDKLCGKVTLTLSKETTIIAVIVSLYGISYTNIEKRVDTAVGGCLESERDHTIVLDEMFQAFPSGQLNRNTAYTLQAGSHTFDFSFTLPLYAMPQGTIGSKARQAQILPPSCSDSGDQMVQYFIKAKATRDSNWSSSITSSEFFVFLPSDDTLDPKLPPSCVKAKGILEKSWWNIVGSAAKTCNSHRWELKGKPNAVPKESYVPELWVTFLAQESLTIASVEFKLESHTFAKARNLKEEFVHSFPVLKLKPNTTVQCSKGKVKVPLDLALQLSEKTTPDFCTQNIRRVYVLVCSIKYGHQKAISPKHSVELRLPVQVQSGITTPDYNTGVVNAPDRKFPMDSYYYTHRARGVAIV